MPLNPKEHDMVKRLIFEGDIPFHPTAKGSYHTGHGQPASLQEKKDTTLMT